MILIMAINLYTSFEASTALEASNSFPTMKTGEICSDRENCLPKVSLAGEDYGFLAIFIHQNILLLHDQLNPLRKTCHRLSFLQSHLNQDPLSQWLEAELSTPTEDGKISFRQIKKTSPSNGFDDSGHIVADETELGAPP